MSRRVVLRELGREDALKAIPGRPRPFEEVVQVFDDVEQLSPEWHALRIGVPTASRFKAIMADGKDGNESETRKNLLYRMAGEILSGEPGEDWSSPAMRRGREMESEARQRFAFESDVELTQVGFVRRTLSPGNRHAGCSPDSLICDDGVLEIKTMSTELMSKLIDTGRWPTEHRAQCQGSLWVTGRRVCTLVVYYRNYPVMPKFEFARDEKYIALLAEQVERFQWELDKLVERIRDKTSRRR